MLIDKDYMMSNTFVHYAIHLLARTSRDVGDTSSQFTKRTVSTVKWSLVAMRAWANNYFCFTLWSSTKNKLLVPNTSIPVTSVGNKYTIHSLKSIAGKSIFYY